MPDKDRHGILRCPGASLITLGAFSLLAILIYSALYFSNPYLAPLHVSYFSNERPESATPLRHGLRIHRGTEGRAERDSKFLFAGSGPGLCWRSGHSPV